MYDVCQARRLIWYKGGIKICPVSLTDRLCHFRLAIVISSKSHSLPSRHPVWCKMMRRLRSSGRYVRNRGILNLPTRVRMKNGVDWVHMPSVLGLRV